MGSKTRLLEIQGPWLYSSAPYSHRKKFEAPALQTPPFEAPSCDRLPEEFQDVSTSNIRGNLSHIGPETEVPYCFYCTTLNFEGNCQNRALCADRRPLRRDTTALRDRFRPMGARQKLALYYKTGIGRMQMTSPQPCWCAFNKRFLPVSFESLGTT